MLNVSAFSRPLPEAVCCRVIVWTRRDGLYTTLPVEQGKTRVRPYIPVVYHDVPHDRAYSVSKVIYTRDNIIHVYETIPIQEDCFLYFTDFVYLDNHQDEAILLKRDGDYRLYIAPIVVPFFTPSIAL